jgi:ferrous iron transport protein B
VPVVPTVAVRKRGLDDLKAPRSIASSRRRKAVRFPSAGSKRRSSSCCSAARRQIALAVTVRNPVRRWTHRLDASRSIPYSGRSCCRLMFVMFQAVFAWSEAPIGLDRRRVQAWLAAIAVKDALPDGFLRSLLVDGVIAGVGAVVVFLPQILILFFFILCSKPRATWSAPPS